MFSISLKKCRYQSTVIFRCTLSRVDALIMGMEVSALTRQTARRCSLLRWDWTGSTLIMDWNGPALLRFHPAGTHWQGRASTTRSWSQVSVDNKSVLGAGNKTMFCAGGRDHPSIMDNILQFDGESQQWEEIGKLSKKRYYHAASVININKIAAYCTATTATTTTITTTTLPSPTYAESCPPSPTHAESCSGSNCGKITFAFFVLTAWRI